MSECPYSGMTQFDEGHIAGYGSGYTKGKEAGRKEAEQKLDYFQRAIEDVIHDIGVMSEALHPLAERTIARAYAEVTKMLVTALEASEK